MRSEGMRGEGTERCSLSSLPPSHTHHPTARATPATIPTVGTTDPIVPLLLVDHTSPTMQQNALNGSVTIASTIPDSGNIAGIHALIVAPPPLDAVAVSGTP